MWDIFWCHRAITVNQLSELTGKMNIHNVLKNNLWSLCESVFEGQNGMRLRLVKQRSR